MTDLISRADAIEAIMKHHDGELNQINYGLTLAKNEIQALPSADAKGGDAKMRNDTTHINEPYMQQSRQDDGRPHGEWQECFNEDFGHMTVCSNCGEEFCDEEVNIKELGWNYCPNCGAQMDMRGDNNE